MPTGWAFVSDVPAPAEQPHSCPVCRGHAFSFQFIRQGIRIVACDGCGLLARDRMAEKRGVAEPRVIARAGPCFDALERYRGWGAEERRHRKVGVLGPDGPELVVEGRQRGYADAREIHVGADAGRWDAIILSDALNSAVDPVGLLALVRNGLDRTGTLLVAGPRVERPAAGAGERVFSPEREYFFDAGATDALLIRAGFEHVRFVRDEFEGMPVLMALAVPSAEGPIDARRGRLSVVLPVYNEKRTFSLLIDQLLQKQLDGLDMEIVIVESRSTDGTRDDVVRVAQHPRVRVVWEDRPRGKGHAVRAGLREATGDFVLIQDADLEYDIHDYDMLLRPLRSFRTAFVLGIRHGKDGHTWKVRQFSDQVLVGHWMNFGHLLFTTLFNVVYGQRLSDPFTMFKVFRRDCLSGLPLECNAFDFDWELAGKLVRSGYGPLELPVNYESRSFSEGKKVRMFRDPVTWIRACFKYRFAPLKEATLPRREPSA